MTKKTRFLCMLLALAMILTLPSANLAAAADSTTYITLYPSADAKTKCVSSVYDSNGDYVLTKKNQSFITFDDLTAFDLEIADTGKIYSVKSSKASVLSVNKKKSKLSYLKNGTESYLTSVAVSYTAKKAGKTKISVKAGKSKKKAKTKTVTVKTVKYSNPVKSLTIAGKTISGTKFNKSSVLRLKYKDYANKKLSLSADGWISSKSGWGVTSAIYWVTPDGSGYNTTRMVGVTSDGYLGFVNEDGTSKSNPKITKKGSWLEIRMLSTSTGRYETLTILFK